ncbi:MAG: DUF1905 domain-containing protein [Candidatus Micrarchaeota archaeon]|nr:DUF1905 domain-containing protein [Candidatus Micrarchaeota archaeon]
MDFMKKLEFKSRILITGVNPYVTVNKSRSEYLKSGWRKTIPVLVQLNGAPKKPHRINLVPKGDGSYYLYLNGQIRKASDTKVGDTVSVLLEFDKNYKNGPVHPMYQWFRVPLSRSRRAKISWDSLPPSRQKEILRYFSRLKSEDARKRNVKRAISVLSGREGRFMGRLWKNGR